MEEMMISPWIDYREYEDLVLSEREPWLHKQIEKMALVCHTKNQNMLLGVSVSIIEAKQIKLSLALIDRLNEQNNETGFRHVAFNLNSLKIFCEGRLYDVNNDTNCDHAFGRVLKAYMKHYGFSTDQKLSGVMGCGKPTVINYKKYAKLPSREHAIRLISGMNLGYNLTHFGMSTVGYVFRPSEDEKVMEFLQETQTDNLLDYLTEICVDVFPALYDLELLASFYKYQ